MHVDTSVKVGFIVPYIGKWPVWARLFFESCRSNPNIDVILLCESAPAFVLPSNVKVVHMSKCEIVSRLEKITNLGLVDIPGHKLCDFRPFFGRAFADLLQDYPFWGYCDIDMMFGDLSSILSQEVLDSVDALSAHSEQFVGHFTILRNTQVINNLAAQIPNWRELCCTEKSEHLDEERFSEVFEGNVSLRWVRPEPLAEELKKKFCRHCITYTFRGKIADAPEGEDAVVRWKDGRTVIMKPDGTETEVLYVHFMATKHWWHWILRRRGGDGSHYFSRVGYGLVEGAADLHCPFPRLVYAFQCAALSCKVSSGRIFRMMLSPRTFKNFRRKLHV